MTEVLRNHLLAALSPGALALLSPHLTRVQLAQGEILYQEGEELTRSYFPETAIVSFVTRLEDGGTTECAVVGREGAIGFVGAACVNVALRQKVVQLGGEALVMDAGRVREAVNASPEILGLMLWSSAVFQSQVLQLVACNARHSVEQRLARWLMQVYDRADGARYPMTHDFLAEMLGVQRASVSIAAHALQKQALIDYGRGKLTVRYPEQLRAVCCECYGRMRAAAADLPRRWVPSCANAG